jgi:hypothetical protein
MHLAAIGQAHQLVGPVELGSGHSQSPLRVDLTHPRQLCVVRTHPARQHLFGQWRTVIRLSGLVADDRQLPGKALLAQRLCSAKPGQRRADNDDATLFLDVRGHADRSSSLPTMIACTGQDAAARNTR